MARVEQKINAKCSLLSSFISFLTKYFIEDSQRIYLLETFGVGARIARRWRRRHSIISHAGSFDASGLRTSRAYAWELKTRYIFLNELAHDL